jgi:hypothetical protein
MAVDEMRKCTVKHTSIACPEGKYEEVRCRTDKRQIHKWSPRLTWGIASLRQTTAYTPGYIAERACRKELLDLAGMMTSPTQ